MSHSLLSPSSFARRRACPGSARMEDGLEDTENVYAAKGTAAHALGEKCLLTGKEPDEFIGQKFGEFKHQDGRIEEFIVDGDMVDDVQVYTDYCRQFAEGRYWAVEKKVQLPFIGKDEKGTADFIGIKSDILHVVDYKNGVGYVDEIENIQGLCYGMGAALEYEDQRWHTLRITIVQPNAYTDKGPVRYWDVSRTDLLDWKMDFAEVAEKTRQPDAPLVAGSHCGWCKARFTCPTRNKSVEKFTGMDLTKSESAPVKIQALTDAQILDLVFNKIPLIMKWCGDIKDYAQQRAEGKNPLPGSKLVETRATRRWKDEKEAEKLLGKVDGAYEKKFKTAPQMEKLLGKKKFESYSSLVIAKSTGVTLVPDTDPRPSARPNGASEFAPVSVDVNLFG